MPPTQAKDAIAVIFDINTTNKEKALQFLSDVVNFKRLSESKDIVKIFLVNTDQTKNSKQYDGIVHFDIGNLTTTQMLDEINKYEPGESSWIEALDIGADILNDCLETPGVVTPQFLFVSDFNAIHADLDVPKGIMQNLNENDVFLYIVGPDLYTPKAILSPKDLVKWKQELPNKTEDNLNKVISLVKKVTHSVICDFHVGFHLFLSYKYNQGMQPWNAPLSFGSCFELPVSTIRVTKEESPICLVSENKKVTENIKWVREDQEDVEVDYANSVPGIVQHGKFVKLEDSKPAYPKSFSVLGFTDSERVPEYLIQSDASYVVVCDLNEPDEHAEFFSCLVDELCNLKKVAIVKRVYNANSNPKLCALVPRTNMTVKCFLMVELPYADDIVYKYEEESISDAPVLSKNEEIFDFLDGINISKKNCKIEVPLGPPMMMDLSCIDIIRKVDEKITGKEAVYTRDELILTDTKPFTDKLATSWIKREANELQLPDSQDIKDDFNDVDDFSFDDD